MDLRHFSRGFAFLTLLGACGGLSRPAAAQSLADVARTEEARRKAVDQTSKEPAKLYTNKDLDSVPAPAEPAPAAEAVKPAEPDKAKGEKDKPKDAEPPKDQKYWGDRAAALRTQLDRDGMFADALQSRINGLTTDFSARDDPAQRAVIERDRQKAIAELDRVKKQIDTDKKAIADLDEEARRGGVPPGWLRP